VVAAADANEIDVLFGAAGGQFQAPARIAVSGNPRGVAVGYFGLASSYSIVYSSYTSGTISFLDYDYETASFTRGATLNAGVNPQGIAVGRFNPSGGYPDIVVANSGSSQMTVFYNSSGTFSRAELKAPAGARGTHLNVIVAADFDKDGRTDLAAASTGDNYVTVWMNSATGLKWSANLASSISSPRGIAAADLNVDGRPEIIVANRGSNSVTIFVANASAPFFTTQQSVSAGSGSRAVAAADFDGDGRVDVATGNEYARAATILWNRSGSGGGTGATAFVLRALPDVTPDSWVMGGPYAVADFNHNGIPDIVVGEGVVLDAKTAVKVDSGRASASISSAVAADFDEDGNVDFAQDTYYYPSPQDPSRTARAVDFMIGDGTGHFKRGTSLPFTSPRGMVTGDFNRDGHADLVVFDDSGAGVTRNVFLGHGDGTFSTSVQPATTYDYVTGAGDIDGDGTLDLVVWNFYTQQINIYFGDGSGDFPTGTVLATVGSLYGTHVADLNGDGRADIVALKNGTTLVSWLGHDDGTLSAPLFSDLPESAYDLVVGDLTGDGHPDVLTSEGTLAIGRGDGTFAMKRNLNLAFTDAVAADIDRDGLVDLFIGTFDYTAMALYNRRVEPPNSAPIAKVWPHTATVSFVSQFDEEGFTLMANKSYDPDIDPISYTWLENDRVLGLHNVLDVDLAAGTHVITLVVRDNSGAESRDTATITITPYQEIVAHTVSFGTPHGAWRYTEDTTAAEGATLWHPNANAAKLAQPLANPVNYVDIGFAADPTQVYKLWVRLKAQGNNPFNDSVFVQFDGAVDGSSGAPVYEIGTTSGLAVNLEECSGCGLSGWGWRDEAWGTRGAIGTVTMRFPPNNGSMWHRLRIQTREDGVMVDQVVLSAVTYANRRPGAVKDDRTILVQTVPEG
jgi:hypothetical protein